VVLVLKVVLAAWAALEDKAVKADKAQTFKVAEV
jgi:hypothetical protein